MVSFLAMSLVSNHRKGRLALRARWQRSFLFSATKAFGAMLFCVPVSIFAATKDSGIEYNRDIRPILTENCFACHGPDSAARKGSLRLDHLEFAIQPRKDSSPAIVPGKPKDSEVVHRINQTNSDDIMPPAKTGKKLTAKQKELIAKWIASGAKYQPLWSFIAPVKPALPAVHNKRWPRNPIDYFILTRLEQEHLKPAPEADRRTLIRRVTLDLTGLPPTPEEVEAFVHDKSPNAYEKVVDRLLASPHYGEHRAHFWLDAARYGDSNGIHFDNYREMWSYRDWVINAYNRNEPFDQFTIDQLAGDLLPHATLEEQVASGFNRCNITSNEGGLIEEEYYVLYARDRTETTAQVWLGLTAGCAVCHDHKYDPFPQKDFYSMSAFFNNTTQKAMDGNVQNTPPTVEVPLPEDRARWAALTGEKQAAQDRIAHRKKSAHDDFEAWLAKNSAEAFQQRLPKDTPAFHALLADDQSQATNQPQTIKVNLKNETREIALATNATASWEEGVVAPKAYEISGKTTPQIADAGDFEKDQPFSYGAWVYLTKTMSGALFARMDDQHDFRGWDLWFEGGKPGTHIINKWPGNALKVVANKAIEANRWTHVCVTYDGSAKVSGVKIYIDGELQAATPQADKLSGSIRTTVPFKIGQRYSTSVLEKAGVQDLRLYSRALNADEVKSLSQDARMAYLLGKPAAERSKKEKEELYTVWLNNFDPEFKAANAALAALEKEQMEIKSRGTEALVMQDKKEPAVAYVLYRGEYDKRREQVHPATPSALPPMPKDFPDNRLGFARWLMLPENPLPARVTVNRFWSEIFGTGIVRTTGDFGVTGEMPSNQQLLDWLAVDFRESGWDVKRFYKQIVMSAAYRQSSALTPEKLAKDPENRLISRGPRFRMDAEMIRDYALAASGLLVPKIGGPSVKPYQPDGVWEAVAMIGSNTRDYKQDAGDNLYRRSLYTFWKRAAPPASMEIFNAPSRETCTVRRERGDTPLQALVTMDDPQFVEAARHLGQLALQKGGKSEDARIDFMAERLLARPLHPEELKITRSSLNDLLAHYKAEPDAADELLTVGDSKADAALDGPTLAAYAMLANELMNLDEVLNK